MNATKAEHYWIAGGILAVSCLTDLVDGKIARKFNMISSVGKVLDPLADKMTQLTLIICLSVHHKVLRIMLALFLIKEFFQLFAMLIFLKRGKALDGALYIGKVCTTVLFTSLFFMVLLPGLSELATDVITAVCCVFLTISFIEYVRAYCGKNKKIHDLES
jgi:cardiolipin synthase